jgi:hypothetical protein
VIALLRDAHGAAASWYGPLGVMPVFERADHALYRAERDGRDRLIAA